MSGPLTRDDGLEAGASPPAEACVEILEGRSTSVGGMPVRRVLPKRQRRTVGAWCFADHFGPTAVAEASMQVGPHPHIGLQTVTWLVAGEVLHTDSLGSEQLIRPGQLNLMTAGRGVAHAEQTPERVVGDLHGVQLWVAQPEATRWDAAAFEHHADLPRVDLDGADATVLVGSFGGVRSPARADSPIVGVELVVRRSVTVPLVPSFEHALVVVEGAVSVGGSDAEPGTLAYLGTGRQELAVHPVPGPARMLLLGGEPFDEGIAMWWNFVARSTEELDLAYRDWQADSERFGDVRSSLDRIAAPRPQWRPLS